MLGRSPFARSFAPVLALLLAALPRSSAAQAPPPAGAPATPAPAAPRPGAAPAAPPAGAAPPAAQATPPAAGAAPADVAPLPPKVEVSDPLLTPVVAAPHTLGTWREVLTIISSRSPDVAIARAEIERAQGSARQALAAALPQINGSGSISYFIFNNQDVGGRVPPFQTIPETSMNAQLVISQPLLAPRAWYGIGTAKTTVKAARFSYDDRRRVTVGQVADAIVAVYTNERVAEINRLGLRAALQRLDLTQRKLRLGDGTRLDVLRAEQDTAVARATLVTGDEQLRRARETLGFTLGANEAWGVTPAISLNDMTQALGTACTPGDPKDRPDVAAARANLEVAQRGVTDAKLLYLPTANANSTTSINRSNATIRSADGAEASTSTTNSSWVIQGVLSVPIWDGGARYGITRSAKAVVEQQKARLDATLRTATIEAAQAQRSVEVAAQSLKIAEQNRDLARESARLAERAFAAGVGTSFDLVDTGRREREAELQLAVREFELVRARIAALLASATCSY